MARNTTLVSKVAHALRNALTDGSLAAGDRLPTETVLAETHGVSRPTVRQALRELEATGLVRTRHGVGTFVVDRPEITAGLEHLDSISESIRAMGRAPGMAYQSRTRRHLLPDEAERMGWDRDSEVVELRRSVLADDEVVAYSYDLIPVSILPPDLELSEINGSLFRFLTERLNRTPVRSLAEIHAVSSAHIGWGPGASEHQLFLLLDQVHTDHANTLVLYSRTYFIEGRYTFSMVRTSLISK